MPSGYVGRFAPSPTGPLHAGSLLAAAASYLQARAAHGRWLLRIEDIDPPREVAGAATDILHTLERFGFEWDGEVVYQSTRIEHYRERLAEIASHTFYCQCSRAQIRRAREAQQRKGSALGTDAYPGTCRQRGLTSGTLRFHAARRPGFHDGFAGLIPAVERPDDFVIWRRDDLPAYQWAVCVDDAEQGITEVVRGADLLDTTPRQIAVMRALKAPVPAFAHVPIVVNADGQKLSKQTGAVALACGGESATLCAAFEALGLAPQAAQISASLSELWSWAIRAWPPSPLRLQGKIASF